MVPQTKVTSANSRRGETALYMNTGASLSIDSLTPPQLDVKK